MISEANGKTTVELNLFYNSDTRDMLLKELNDRVNVREKELKSKIKSGELLIGLYSAGVTQINHQQCIISIINDITDRKIAEV